MTHSVRRVGGDYVAACLAEVSGIVKGVSDTPLWSASDTQVTELLTATARAANQLAALQLRLVAEVHSRDLASRTGASSTQAWLRGTLRLTPGEAKKQVGLAAAVTRDLDHTRDTLSQGAVSVAHAQVIAQAVDELPTEVDRATREQAESFLVEQALTFDPHQVARLGRRILEVVDPDTADTDEARRLTNQEKRAHQRRHLTFTPDGHGTIWLRGRLDTESAAIVRRALDPLAKPRPTDPDQPDTRSPGARTADALVEVCRRTLTAGDLPTQRGEKPRIVVTVDAGKLRRQVGSGSLDTGEQLSPAAVRRIACDAEVTPAILDGDSIPLHLGRTVRLFTPAQRRALILRDKGCAFPGCDRPPHWCDAHHIHHWIDGGATDLNNGVLLCGHHHRLIHRGEWRITIAGNGYAEFIPP